MMARHIIGTGIAGLSAALAMAPEPVILITASTLDDGAASLWSQGGIAAAIGDDDSPEHHEADTLAAGDGLCDADAVSRIIGTGPAMIKHLRDLGVVFDDGLGLEAAHSRRRIAHVRDRTGLAITQALARAVRAAPHVTILEHTSAIRLEITDGRIAGLWVRRNQATLFLPSRTVLIATGGIGALYHHTSNPRGATGSGLALAARAGAVLRDLEFVQFHPTGFANGQTPMPLISEAVRGEGATLIDETGARFTTELATRDAVSRAVFHHYAQGHRVRLDATRLGDRFALRFPAIDAACKASGIDPARTPIPVRPVAHYHMGGIAVDTTGRTSVDGLFAAGEAACTGLHGANRLASNSLLEALCTGHDAGIAMANHVTPPPRSHTFSASPHRIAATGHPDSPKIRTLVSASLGVLRDAAGLATLIGAVGAAAGTDDLALLALLLGLSADDRRESRGAHARTDHPEPSAEALHSEITMHQALARVVTLSPTRRAA